MRRSIDGPNAVDMMMNALGALVLLAVLSAEKHCPTIHLSAKDAAQVAEHLKVGGSAASVAAAETRWTAFAAEEELDSTPMTIYLCSGEPSSWAQDIIARNLQRFGPVTSVHVIDGRETYILNPKTWLNNFRDLLARNAEIPPATLGQVPPGKTIVVSTGRPEDAQAEPSILLIDTPNHDLSPQDMEAVQTGTLLMLRPRDVKGAVAGMLPTPRPR